MAGHVFNNADNFDSTMNIVLSIVLIAVTVMFVVFFALQVMHHALAVVVVTRSYCNRLCELQGRFVRRKNPRRTKIF